MPKAYWITCYREIKDPAKLAAYAKLAPVALAPFGVRYICRGSPNATFEAGLKERLVVSEFPSLEKAIAGHDRPAYQEALRALGDGAVRDIRIIERAGVSTASTANSHSPASGEASSIHREVNRARSGPPLSRAVSGVVGLPSPARSREAGIQPRSMTPVSRRRVTLCDAAGRFRPYMKTNSSRGYTS